LPFSGPPLDNHLRYLRSSSSSWYLSAANFGD
jgi:hypothetical protein